MEPGRDVYDALRGSCGMPLPMTVELGVSLPALDVESSESLRLRPRPGVWVCWSRLNEYRLDHVGRLGDGDWYDEPRMACLSGVTEGETHSDVRRGVMGEMGERTGVCRACRLLVGVVGVLAVRATWSQYGSRCAINSSSLTPRS